MTEFLSNQLLPADLSAGSVPDIEQSGVMSVLAQRASGKIAAVALAANVLLSGASTPQVEEIPHGAEPSATAIQHAEELLRAPNPVDTGAIDFAIHGDSVKTSPEKDQRAQFTIDKAVASHYGLTVRDVTPYIVDLKEDLYRPDGPRLPFDTYFARAQAFFATYGVDLHILKKDEWHETGEHAPDPAQLNGPCHIEEEGAPSCARQDVVGLMNALSHLPQEYINLVNLKHAVYAAGAVDAAAYALVGGPHDTVHFEIGSTRKETVFLHEVGHELAAVEHAGGDEDPVLVTSKRDDVLYDEGVPYGNAKTNIPRTYGTFSERKAVLLQQRSTATRNGEYAKACKLEREIIQAGRRVVFSDTYGATAPAEYAAQLDANLTKATEVSQSGVDGNYFDPLMPNLRRQAVANLARLGEKSWPLAAYFVMSEDLGQKLAEDSACKFYEQ